MAGKQNPLISISLGKLAGKWDSKDDIAVFKGIPYAKAPVGDLRWKAPQKLTPWEGIRSAQKHGAVAWQRATELPVFLEALVEGQGWGWFKTWGIKKLIHLAPKPQESEDCLYLNIRTPSIDPEAKLPVMVWIHGGDHQDGSGIDPYYLGNSIPKEGIVYVSINYRLGLMGNFAHPELSAESSQGVSGNYGTLDQIAALQWVQDHIAAFGGDADNVTIFGESAGGESVAHMMTSPLSQGLFHRAIMESPANAGQMIHLDQPFMNYPSAEEQGRQFAQSAGVQGENQVEQLRKMPAKEIQKLVSGIMEGGSFYPNIDGHVLPQSPFSAFQKGQQHQVPVIIGSNTNEGSIIHPMIPVPLPEYHYVEAKENELPSYMQEEFGEDLERVIALYPGLEKREKMAESQFLGDVMFGSKARFYAEEAAKSGPGSYFYTFTRVPPSNTQTAGAFHAAELPFVHGTNTPILPMDEKDKALSRKMIKYWTRFAKSGNPNGEGTAEWENFDPAKPAWMHLGIDELGMKEVALEEHYEIMNKRTLRLIAAMEELKEKA